jgi:hypothetical protein
MNRTHYLTDMSDAEWNYIAPFSLLLQDMGVPGFIALVTFSTLFSICCEVDARGICFPTISHPGKRYTAIFACDQEWIPETLLLHVGIGKICSRAAFRVVAHSCLHCRAFGDVLALHCIACYNAESTAGESTFMAYPEHVEHLTPTGHIITYVSEFSRFRQRMRQADEPRARWARRKQDH